jgi:hypothetical protein
MLDQEQKLMEAEYFFSQMVESFNKDLLDSFTYNLSAFLSAARSIFQYTHDRAKTVGRVNDYNNLIATRPILRYFKEKRDVNIHVQPVKPVQQVTMSVHCSIRIRENVDIQVIEPDGRISLDLTHESPASTEAEKPLPGPTISRQYRFEDWDDDEDVMKLSEQYLQNLRAFIQEARTNGLI